MKFYVIKTNTFFLLNLADMNRLKVYFNNVENLLIDKIKISSIIKRFDHDFLLWKNSYFLHFYITQFFEFNFCYLTDVELRQLHKRFDHSFITKLHDLLKRSDHEVKKAVLKKLTKFCIFCQKYVKSSERFKFTLKNDANCNFKYSIIVDVMYIENISFCTYSTTSSDFKLLNDCKTSLLNTSEICFVCTESTFIWISLITY
jgi:6-pyruvoyl-tetrahydropterin synthase